MANRPIRVTVIAWLYIAVGVIATAAHLSQFNSQQPFQYDIVWASLTNLLALLAGIYMLRGADWARWVAIAWIGFHVILSIFHPWSELGMHILFFAALTYLLTRPEVSRYFRPA